MSGTVDLFGVYVRRRLDHWGREFALGRDCVYLGHQSKNVLQLLVEFGGEMPPRQTGYAPLSVDAQAHEIELIVMDVARANLERACCLRGYYCGSGRRANERFDIANELIIRSGGRRVSRHNYFLHVKLGAEDVSAALLAGVRV